MLVLLTLAAGQFREETVTGDERGVGIAGTGERGEQRGHDRRQVSARGFGL